MTMLAVSIMVEESSAEAALAAAARAAEFGADLVEYRIDRIADDIDTINALLSRTPLPCVVTCRPTWEGGEYDGNDADRMSLFEHLGSGPHPPAYLDVELAAYERSANLRQKVGFAVDHPDQQRPLTTGLILSSHDFDRRPKDLLQKIAKMAEARACRVIKVAWHARSLRDNLEAFELIEKKYKPTIALCMGQFGLPSRVLAKKFGGLLTFAALDAQSATAPGQPTIDELKNLYRWDAQRGSTRVYGVIGWPVGHSMSPPVHNAGFDAVDEDAVYLPMPIPPEYEHFKATVGSWLDHAGLHFRGASVTIPHKANLLHFVEESGGEIEPLAAAIGAANTLTKREDDSLYASNSDYAAALDSVCAALDIEREGLTGKQIAVLGAGGAARAVVAGFADAGAGVTVFNRTPEKAAALAERFQAAAAKPEELRDLPWDVLINCTPVGMHPNVDATPVLKSDIEHRKSQTTNQPVVFDTIYNPIQTRLLRDAKAAGCLTVPGTEMFVRQAATQFELWTGKVAPLEVFRSVLESRLT